MSQQDSSGGGLLVAEGIASEDATGHGAAALAAVEVLLWQLVRAGAVDTMPLANELARYARLYDAERRAPGDAAAAQSLYALAGLVLGAARLRDGSARRRAGRGLAESSAAD